VGKKYVAAVTGSKLHVLDRATGHIVWERDLKLSPGAGPAVTDEWVWVPMIGGTINAFSLQKAGAIPWTYASAGRVLTQPMVSMRSVCWTTERGHMYVADADVPGVRFRLEAKTPIETSPAYWTPYLYAASLDGYVMAVDDTSAARDRMVWKFPTGSPIRVAPVAVAGRLFVAPERAGLYCLDAKTGDQLWYAPGIKHFLSLSATRVYATDDLNRLVALDANTGNQQGTLSLDPQAIRIANAQSDRIYLGTRNGLIQCLHEVGQPQPLRHALPPLPKFEEKSVGKPKAPAEVSEEALPEEAEPSEQNEPADEPVEDPAPAEEPESPKPEVIGAEDLFG
jgi:outer membrane protein assembly factor BamB